METKVTVLIEGYAKKVGDGWMASSTTVLLEDSDKTILVDPGINRELLLQKLRDEGLAPDDIDIVFMTHYHPDHAFLAALFENAIVVDGDTIYENDRETAYEGTIPGTTIEVLATAGHAHEHHVLVVSTEKGTIVIAGDVFWWSDEEEQDVRDVKTLLNKEDPFTKDAKALRASRRQVLEVADWIIPGHGMMFKNPRKASR